MHKKLKAIISLVVAVVITQQGYTQDLVSDVDLANNPESFSKISDEEIRREVRQFTIAGSRRNNNRDSSKSLTEIPCTGYTDSSITFLKRGIMVTVKSERSNKVVGPNKSMWGLTNEVLQRRITAIKYIHEKYMLVLPNEATVNLFNPNFCSKGNDCNRRNKRGKLSTQSKVFRSKVANRLYLYMINGSLGNRYEVTWIIVDSKYYTRVIDKI